ncbi:MAG TPA: hypothetical protein VH025_09820 [Solirubrobacteraceae bacterium]|jgi:hypothetical protein|nr:hypothetical protein [Solirubrobacteraceae bacterium]
MPRITVTTDLIPGAATPAVLFDEQVTSVHLSTGHAAAQLVERIAWSIIDAERADGSVAQDRPRQRRPVPARERIPAHASAIRERSRRALAA